MIRAYAKACGKPSARVQRNRRLTEPAESGKSGVALLLSGSARVRRPVSEEKGRFHGGEFDGIAQLRWSTCR